MVGHDVIVAGASAGGVEALVELARSLPAGLPATLFVACHFPPQGRSNLPHILSRSGRLLAQHARDGEMTHPGHIYVAPPDFHLVVQRGHVQLTRAARENHHRPAIDMLFRSAARAYGPRVVAVVLSGYSHDGVAGLIAVRAAGGLAIVQDPLDALVPDLPSNAREIAGADHVASASAIVPLLVELVHRPAGSEGGPNTMDPLERLSRVVDNDMAKQERGERRGEISVFICPECGGGLWQVDEKDLLRFRCHVGHSYYGETLLGEQAEALEAALWTAIRLFREKAVLSRQLATAERQRSNLPSAQRFEEQARQAERNGELIQKYLLTDLPSYSEPSRDGAAPGEEPTPARPASPPKLQEKNET
jgi:two-component system chemotaxis response regulator CheB